MIYIGIDPGVNTGFAVWNPESREFESLESLTFWEAVNGLEYHETRTKGELIVFLEDVNANRPTFDHHRVNAKQREKISQNIGANKRDAQLIEQYCEANGIKVNKIRPSRSKWTAETFKAYTGYEGRTNEHKRDAARLVYGRV